MPPPTLDIQYHRGIVRTKSMNDIVLMMSEQEAYEHNRVTVMRCADTADARQNNWAGRAWHASANDPIVHLTLEFSNGNNGSWKRHVTRENYKRMKAEYRARVQIFEDEHVTETRKQKIKNLLRLIARKLDDYEGVDLNYETEVMLLNEVRNLGSQVQELEEILREEVSRSSEVAEGEGEGERSHLRVRCVSWLCDEIKGEMLK